MMNGDETYRMPLGTFNDKADSHDLRREWEEWHRAFELYLEMRNIEAQHDKLVTMLAVGGRGLQRIFFNLRPGAEEITSEPVKIPLMPPEIPEYDNAIKRLEKFFVGKRNERVELEVFRSIKQSSQESFNNFILRLRSQASRCEFSSREETEILQQITMGARDDKVRDKGLENAMTLDEVINYAINREILVNQREKLKPFRGETELNHVSSGQNRNRNASLKRDSKGYRQFERQPYGRQGESRKQHGRFGVQCDRCGSTRHARDSRECFARGATCNRCGHRGHYARKCIANSSSQRESRYARRANDEDVTNSLESSKEKWEENVPHRPTADDVAKVE
ncbi:uncharacterized protein LOC131432485 [Malaya genurostris]|uniref:uncharacterized protein LOC131432485 n=1 Tax=Malaya genurostris TaxID=325434 RepID=UPI0026F3C8CB|nr:uncharacterized protein LOC131432485 [Malaya genurostris]